MINFWTNDITVYNKNENGTTGVIIWYKHNLSKCFIKRTNNKFYLNGSAIQSDDNILRIPIQKDYITPFEWQTLTDEQKSEHLTLQTGDIIILGNVNDTINEYATGERSSDLIAKYKNLGSLFITSVNENTILPNKHYLVRGI